MKKILSLLLCVLLLCSMLSITAFAVEETLLPDGGSATNTGTPRAMGYTTGGSTGRAYMICTVFLDTGSVNGKCTYQGISRMLCTAYLYENALTNVFVRTNTYSIVHNQKRSSGQNVLLTLTVNTTDMSVTATNAIATQSYSSSEYGSWKCATTATTFGQE